MSFIIRGISSILGSVLPCFFSYKILQKPNKPKLIECVQYWCVYSAYLSLDWFANTFFISCFVPCYDLLSLMVLVLITIPQIGVSPMLYKKFLAPFLRKNERKIEKFLNSCLSHIWNYGPSIITAVMGFVKNLSSLPSQGSIEYQVDDSVVELDDSINQQILSSVKREMNYDDLDYIEESRVPQNRRVSSLTEDEFNLSEISVGDTSTYSDYRHVGDEDARVFAPVTRSRNVRNRKSSTPVEIEDTSLTSSRKANKETPKKRRGRKPKTK